MNTRCEDVTDRLMELLYDELPAAERAPLEAHIAGCARCQAEVASFQKTRAAARSVLAAPPPAGARQRLIAAAMANSAAKTATTPPAPVSALADGGGFWAWLRQRWALPTLATMGVMAVFLLASRLFLNPEKTYRRGQEIAAPAAEAPAPAPPRPPEAAREPGQAAAPATNAAPVARRRVAAPVRPGKATPRQIEALKDKRDALEGQLKFKSGDEAHFDEQHAAPPAGAAKPEAPPIADLLGGQPVDNSLSGVEGIGSRAPIRGGGGLANQRGASAGTAAPRVQKAQPFPAAGANEGAREEESRAAPRPSMRKMAADQPAPAAPAAPPAPSAPAAQSAPAEKKAASGGQETLPQRADRLFREHRWPEAAAAYEQLLRQFPQSPAVTEWRQRLAVARAGGPPRASP